MSEANGWLKISTFGNLKTLMLFTQKRRFQAGRMEKSNNNWPVEEEFRKDNDKG
jgi:hypothetical protein